MRAFTSIVFGGIDAAPGPPPFFAARGLQAGQALLSMLALAVIMASVALIFGLPPLRVMGWPLLVAAIGLGAMLNGTSTSNRLALAVSSGLAIALSPWGASLFIDVSADGQEYHYDTIYALAHGWNPFRAPYAGFAPPEVTILIWPQHYPVGAPLLTAMVRNAGLSLAASKGILWLPGVAVPGIWFALLRGEGLAPRSAAALALLAAASPIYIAQLRSEYVDGFVAALAMAFVGLLLVALRQRRLDSLACALACLILATDTKFNAIAIFGTISAAVCLTMVIRRRIVAAFGLGLLLLGALLFVVLFIGSFPYITNWSGYGHPFYPIMGTDRYEVNNALLPGAVRDLPAIVIFLGTTFSVFARGFAGGPGAIFDFAEGGWPDGVVGGFGPIFGLALLLAIAIALVTLRHRRRSQARAMAGVIFLIAAMLLVSSLVTPYMWWPRFIPQLWICVYLCLVGAVLSDRSALVKLGWTCAAILAVNSAFVSVNSVRNGLSDSAVVRQHIARVKARGVPFCAAFGAAHARIELMREAGIKVEPMATGLPVECKGSEVIPLARDFLENPAQSCPCAAVPAALRRSGDRPADTTLADIERLFERSK
ncbi:hypothetical protein [Novosphingobium album (ex Hu et al. 2023)]|uniref:Glycosyltransferase RgtA/B/C/D-like domain-containing protein n=1 Tax=Novosphingobium album (ex Hu et al. 2023) TaxID=2930093 RepID=A0ABT0B421_9SPHN|nr:hypothetical protein [Novosphingobium album (ex Hu et al. 2023)]MCJ2179812.1 hypothetical protein [Novosphingobium album (ex Hu et al. 2023)]